ncbi:acetyl-CoA C-acyltransferase [Alkalicaulis satelles]|uniref:Acetyl-CoA C-acyltransferase n=1 Tax=Alkalicaulis satelles TaxID=2609175 RepID=A0A5M6ZST8_9PROT|nr:acetyl-CoA C-acyltransferase [Alkalicaulis satelles]KAA5805391.1 acetyl-CoA C-acyltransferase [Alkalicaulis satelles]
MKLSDAYLYDAVRTPRGKGREGGALAHIGPHELVSQLVAALKDRTSPDAVESASALILGSVGQIGSQGGNIALVSRLHAGLPHETAAWTLNNFCVAGLTATGQAAALASAGEPALMLAGGVEMLSQVPFMGDKASYYTDPDLSRALRYAPVALSADLMATKEGLSRAELDAEVIASHERAAQAWAQGRHDAAVAPVRGPDGAIVLARDECIREGMDQAALDALPPAFAKMGAAGYDAMMLKANPGLEAVSHLHSVAHCPPMADGAALTLIGSRAAGDAAGLKPKARILARIDASGDPVDQLTAGFAAMDALLSMTGLSLDDFDRIEFMEAFAAVPAKFRRDRGADPSKVNVNGGHLAMGHPMGATGAILLTTLVHELERCGGALGLAVAHGGSGTGSAMIVERS